MRIAITTPTGNIGRELTKRLLDQGGHELIRRGTAHGRIGHRYRQHR
ncbi:MAG: hypothetical protein ACREIE_04705 [Nitrospiraceae bacterium]